MTNEAFLSHVRAFIQDAGFQEPFEIIPVNGGGNNRVFLIRQEGDHISGVLKQYYHAVGDTRDRLSTEYTFSQFLWNNDIRRIARPIACDPPFHLGLYSYIDGRKLDPREVIQEHIQQALFFFQQINRCKHVCDADQLPNASESCFSLVEHLDRTEKRILRLEKIIESDSIDKEARHLVIREMLPLWTQIRTRIEKHVDEQSQSLDEQIPITERCLSPSDFGFHNALLNKKGELFFIDFEYAGWDDPAKVVCDFFCQPAIPVPKVFFSKVRDSVISGTGNPENLLNRIDMLMPVYQIKWCCIILNDFLPRGENRREFMENNHNSEEIKEIQLKKAKEIVAEISGE